MVKNTRRRLGVFATAALGLALSGCASMGYYAQSLSGHLDLMSRTEPLDRVLARDDLPPATRERLQLAQEVRRFGVEELRLPSNGSYTRYADLQRPYVVWNVVATPEFSVQPQRWCFWVVGCLSYRGYFDKSQAIAEARRLEALGYDVQVSGSQAYSTLGWFDDPLLNTFINRPEADLVDILLHEMAHQRLYIKHATAFNESFAVAVAKEGMRRWFARHEQPEVYMAYQNAQERRSDFNGLLIATRERLRQVYAEDHPETEMRARKAAVFDELHAQYALFKERWDGYRGYDGWMARDLNNAHLSLVATYAEWVPAFEHLLTQVDGDISAFYREARRIGGLPRHERLATLNALVGREMLAESPAQTGSTRIP